jgi:hypothetical protein
LDFKTFCGSTPAGNLITSTFCVMLSPIKF